MGVRKIAWGDKLRNLVDFIRAYTVDMWKPRGHEWVVYAGPNLRYRIIKERQHDMYDNPEAYVEKGLGFDAYSAEYWRMDFFGQRGVDIDEEDRLFFARQLEQTLWQETSYNDRRYIIAVLLEMQKEDDKHRDGTGWIPNPVARLTEVKIL